MSPLPCQLLLEPRLSEFPRIRLLLQGDAIVQLELRPEGKLPYPGCDDERVSLARLMVDAFFDCQELPEEMPLRPQGTAFQQRVWAALSEIPCSQTRTYGELATALGSSARAVAGACRANPIALLIPCHRVVARNGIGGYGGSLTGPGVALKRRLLVHEQAL